MDESMLNEHLAVPVVQYLREIAGEAHVAYVTHHGVRREQHGHAADPLRPVLLASVLSVFPAAGCMGSVPIPFAKWAS